MGLNLNSGASDLRHVFQAVIAIIQEESVRQRLPSQEVKPEGGGLTKIMYPFSLHQRLRNVSLERSLSKAFVPFCFSVN
jgi:hypothetical protein